MASPNCLQKLPSEDDPWAKSFNRIFEIKHLVGFNICGSGRGRRDRRQCVCDDEISREVVTKPLQHTGKRNKVLGTLSHVNK